MKRLLSVLLILAMMAVILAACSDEEPETTPTQAPTVAAQPAAEGGGEGGGGLPAEALQVAQERGLTPADIRAALMTYVPSGKMDEYYLFSSGGQSGNVVVIGVPSMRILKNIAVFTPEAWQGYGYGDVGTEAVLDGGNVDGTKIRMGDTHHPAPERDQRRL